MDNEKLSPTSLAFIALTNEYCQLVEDAGSYDRNGFVESVLKLLPRIYITVTDIEQSLDYYGAQITQSLDEEGYNSVRGNIAYLIGEDDVYLEVFLDDMKYSDTPIATSISENLADLYQEFYNLIAAVKDLNTEDQRQLLNACKDNFVEYWGATLCNVLRALHAVSMKDRDYFNNY